MQIHKEASACRNWRCKKYSSEQGDSESCTVIGEPILPYHTLPYPRYPSKRFVFTGEIPPKSEIKKFRNKKM